MNNQFRSKEYRELYLKFLKLEIPNFIQIITLLSFFSYLSKNRALDLVIDALVLVFMNAYFFEKFFEFEKSQIFDIHSERNRKGFEKSIWTKKYKKYILITFSIFYALVVIISFTIRVSLK